MNIEKGFNFGADQTIVGGQTKENTGTPLDEDTQVPETVNERPVDDQEQAEIELQQLSLEVAKKKLEKISSPYFHRFGLRFMNLSEYRDTLAYEQSMGDEVNLIDSKDQSMTEYLKKLRAREGMGGYFSVADRDTKGWAATSAEMTDWKQATINLVMYDKALNLLRDSHHQVQENPEIQPTDYRKQTVELFRQNMKQLTYSIPVEDHHGGRVQPFRALEYIQGRLLDRDDPAFEDGYWGGLDLSHRKYENDIQNQAQLKQDITSQLPDELKGGFIDQMDLIARRNIQERRSYHISDEIRRLLTGSGLNVELEEKVMQYVETKRLWDFLGEENLNYLQEFMTTDHPEEMDLRKIFEIISYSQPARGKSDFAQYQIALLYDLNVSFGLQPGETHAWSNFARSAHKDKEFFSQKVLGAVAMMPNRELWQEMAKMSLNAGEIAHPIFDRDLIVRFPKLETSNEVSAEG